MKMVDSSQCLFYLSVRRLSLKQPDATAMETWCAESVSAMMAGETLIIHSYKDFFFNLYVLPLLLHLCQMMDCCRPLGSTKSLFFSLICPCLSFRLSTFCNCSASSSALATSQCIGPGMTEPCSGRGDCLECGTCVCYNPEQFEGPYCQYDKTQCQRFGGFLCNGTTVCHC